MTVSLLKKIRKNKEEGRMKGKNAPHLLFPPSHGATATATSSAVAVERKLETTGAAAR